MRRSDHGTHWLNVGLLYPLYYCKFEQDSLKAAHLTNVIVLMNKYFNLQEYWSLRDVENAAQLQVVQINSFNIEFKTI